MIGAFFEGIQNLMQIKEFEMFFKLIFIVFSTIINILTGGLVMFHIIIIVFALQKPYYGINNAYVAFLFGIHPSYSFVAVAFLGYGLREYLCKAVVAVYF